LQHPCICLLPIALQLRLCSQVLVSSACPALLLVCTALPCQIFVCLALLARLAPCCLSSHYWDQVNLPSAVSRSSEPGRLRSSVLVPCCGAVAGSRGGRQHKCLPIPVEHSLNRTRQHVCAYLICRRSEPTSLDHKDHHPPGQTHSMEPSCKIEEVADEQSDQKIDPAGQPATSDGDDEAPAPEPPAAASAAAAAAPPDASDPPPAAAAAAAIQLTPPEDCEAVTPDRGVLKKTLVPGSGERPALHARCLGGALLHCGAAQLSLQSLRVAEQCALGWTLILTWGWE